MAMKKFKKLSVIDSIKITEDVKTRLQSLSDSLIIFPKDDTKTNQEVIERIGDSDAVLGSWITTINKGILDSSLNLRYIGICGTSMANIDLDAVKEKGITIKNVTDYGDEATAEYIFTQLLRLARGFGKYQWRKEPAELNGKTIGIVGLGAVGQEVARLALGFNMNVLYSSPSRKLDWENRGLKHRNLDELLQESDIISLHVPKNLVILREKEFNLIPKGSILVDTCLGVVFDGKAFLNWINKGNNFTIFDLSKKEFFDTLKTIPNNIIGLEDGIAGITTESRDRLSKKVLNNLKKFLDSGR